MTGSLRLPAHLGPLLVFGALAGVVLATEHYLVHRLEFRLHPSLLPPAVVFDVLVMLPGLFYWLVVQRYRLPISTVAVAFGACLGVCRWLLPAGQLPLLKWLGGLAIGLEALTLSYTLLQLRRIVQAYRNARQQSLHVVENLLLACQSALGPLAPLVATEVTMLRYAVLGAWARPEVGAADRAFSTHRQSGFGALVGALGGMLVLESVAVHLVLAHWYPLAAWVLTVGSAYSLLWLLAHSQAVRCRPVLLSETALVVRVGFCWRVTIPRSQVIGVQQITGDLPASAAGCLNLAKLLFTPPNVLLHLTEPHVVQGLFGWRRTTRCLACYLDEPQALVQQLTPGLA